MGKERKTPGYGIGFHFRRILRLVPPAELEEFELRQFGKMWVRGEISLLQSLYTSCEQVNKLKTQAARRRMWLNDFSTGIFRQTVERFTRDFGGDPEKLVKMKPLSFFAHAAPTVLNQGLINLIREEPSSRSIQIIVSSIESNLLENINNRHLPDQVQGVLDWFYREGLAKAVKVAQKQHESQKSH